MLRMLKYDLQDGDFQQTYQRNRFGSEYKLPVYKQLTSIQEMNPNNRII